MKGAIARTAALLPSQFSHCKFSRSPPRCLPCLLQRAQGELEQLHGAHSVLVRRMRCIEGSEQACRCGKAADCASFAG